MLKKAKTILRSESGMSIIIVLSIGALFVALSAAVLYAASLQTASANRVLPQEDAYRMAYSFVENVLEPDLDTVEKSGTTPPLKLFLMNQFLNPSNGYATDDAYHFVADDGTSTGETITVTLRKGLVNGAALSGTPTPLQRLAFGAATTKEDVEAFNNSDFTKYTINMTVEVEVGGESYALTKKYTCYARYAYRGSVFKYNTGTEFAEVGIRGSTAELDELKDGAATGYYVWLPEGGEG